MGGQRKFHRGIDIAAPIGRLVRSSREGKVVFVGRQDTLGMAIVMQHDGDYSTVFGHLSAVHVKLGERVQQGDPIGRVGNTGLSTGPHLHFEIRKSGRAIDPRPLLP